MTPETIRLLLSGMVTDADLHEPCPACGDPAMGRPIIWTEYGPVHAEHDERTVLRYALDLAPASATLSVIQLDAVEVGLLSRRADGSSLVSVVDGDQFRGLVTAEDWLDAFMALRGLV